jgi:hypothetical protein
MWARGEGRPATSGPSLSGLAMSRRAVIVGGVSIGSSGVAALAASTTISCRRLIAVRSSDHSGIERGYLVASIFSPYISIYEGVSHQYDPQFVCQGLSCSIYFLIDHYYSPGPQNSEVQPISHPQTSETQPSLLPLQVTGTYLYASILIST